MSIATKITVIVALLAGLMLFGAGYSGRVLHESDHLVAVRDQGRLLVQVLKTAAEADPRNHGQLGALADLVTRRRGQSVTFFGPDARAIAPVPVAEEPKPDPHIRKVLDKQQARESVVGDAHKGSYVHRTPLWAHSGSVAGALELRIDLQRVQSLQWRQTTLMIAGALLLFFALLVALFAHNSIGRPITRLMDGMDAVIRGDLTHTIPLDRNDEIGRIAYRFNEMTARLRAAQDEIRSNADAKLQLEGSLRRSEKLATIGQLSAEIAHEVGTPLNVIGGRAHTLKRKAERPAEVRKNAEIIAGQVTRITKIIQQVLDLARVPVRRREAVNLLRVVDDAVAFLEYQITQSGVVVARDYQRDTPTIEAEPDGIQQVVLNVLVNALQAMPDGGELRLKVEATHRRKGGLDLAPPQSYLALAVQDTGVGIPEEDRARVFDPFFSTKAKGEGTGLGLTVVHGIVKEHDGWIEVDGAPEGGTVFRVFFPLDAGDDVSVDERAADDDDKSADDGDAADDDKSGDDGDADDGDAADDDNDKSGDDTSDSGADADKSNGEVSDASEPEHADEGDDATARGEGEG